MNWIETTVGEYCPFVYGKSLPKTQRTEGDIPVFGSNGCVDYHNKSYVNGPGIIIGRKGSVGAVHLSVEPFWPIDTSFYVEKESIDELKFTYYLLKSLGLKGMNSDSAVPGLNRENAHALPIRIPEKIQDREKLGQWISVYDSKIELNRQTNQTLEQIAQAIFKSWFVDFDPVRAKIAANTAGENAQRAAIAVISGKNQAALDQLEQQYPAQYQQLQATADLFPDNLIDSGLGEIPDGWEVVGFKDIIRKYIDNRGKTPPTAESGIPLLEVKHLPDGSIKPSLNTSKYVDIETFNSWFRAHLEAEDILISTVGTIGRICMVPKGVKVAIAQNLLGMRFQREKVSPYFMYYQMDSLRFRHDIDARLVVTVQASIKRKDLETIDLLAPPVALQNEFEKLILPFIEILQSNQSIELASTRDALLPKLLSGELSIDTSETEF
ncbi:MULTISPECIES: restriction endonuclease subunit S [unclassified Pseudoalteromonas]|jgi:type I restriction enzyme S subunit|uniref:restriction endonuclease subunit S n=1 Tax=unclassified Pseudoalteromonas TaxID=194690 RepID=UPI0001EF8EFE|nr:MULTISPECIES: restriction endonuclease subunit S [unclassified Pseudoalteromonas]ADT69764.1 restriction modification system DNA specificity subunit [Pseudoalteromonas sp. SM9913]